MNGQTSAAPNHFQDIVTRANEARELAQETKELLVSIRDIALARMQVIQMEAQANREAIVGQLAEVTESLGRLLAERIEHIETRLMAQDTLAMAARDAGLGGFQSIQTEAHANRDAIISQLTSVAAGISNLVGERTQQISDHLHRQDALTTASRDALLTRAAEALHRLNQIVAERNDVAIQRIQQVESATLISRDAVLTSVASMSARLEAKVSDALSARESLTPEACALFPPIGEQLFADVDVFGHLQRAAPESFAAAEAAAAQVRALLPGQDVRPLARSNPSNDGFDWDSYLHLSTVRVVAVLEALARFGVSGRVLDYGAYFGNFSLALREAGFNVDAVDSFRDYDGCFDRNLDLLRSAGVTIHDTADVAYELHGLPASHYDAAICLGVIEHIPHTPRLVLEGIDRVLKSGGVLLIDTPNLAYIFNRRKLAKGGSLFPNFAQQYATQVPFGGHHREYVPDEIRWIVEDALGHELLDLQMFNYSMAGHRRLSGDELTAWRIMESDPSQREIIFAVSRKR